MEGTIQDLMNDHDTEPAVPVSGRQGSVSGSGNVKK